MPIWCRGRDLNPHRRMPTAPSRPRVYQFHHLGLAVRCTLYHVSRLETARIERTGPCRRGRSAVIWDRRTTVGQQGGFVAKVTSRVLRTRSQAAVIAARIGTGDRGSQPRYWEDLAIILWLSLNAAVKSSPFNRF